MCTTHIGKIGRLSKDTRIQLGQRLEDGLPGTEIVQWLNGLPDVQQVLQDQFTGRPITEQNLSAWKQAGHRDWLLREQARQSAERIAEQADALGQITGGKNVSDFFADVFAAKMVCRAKLVLDRETDPEKRWQRIRQINREVSQLRRDDHRAQRNDLNQKKWQFGVQCQDPAGQLPEVQDLKNERADAVVPSSPELPAAKAMGGGKPDEQMTPPMPLPLQSLPCSTFRIPDPAQSAKALAQKNSAIRIPQSALSSVGWEKEDLSFDLPRRSPAEAGALAQKNSALRTPHSALNGSNLIQPNPAKKNSAVHAFPRPVLGGSGRVVAWRRRDGRQNPFASCSLHLQSSILHPLWLRFSEARRGYLSQPRVTPHAPVLRRQAKEDPASPFTLPRFNQNIDVPLSALKSYIVHRKGCPTSPISGHETRHHEPEK